MPLKVCNPRSRFQFSAVCVAWKAALLAIMSTNYNRDAVAPEADPKLSQTQFGNMTRPSILMF